MDKTQLELVRGTLDVLILKALAWGRLHGYAITNLILRQSDEALLVEPTETESRETLDSFVAAVERISVSELADPETRVTVRGPSGYLGPAFRVKGLLIWGFTAVLVDRLLALAGWERPWDTARVIDL